MKTPTRNLLVAPLVALAAAACSAAPAAEEPTPMSEEAPIAIQVSNELTPATSITVEVLDPDTGVREVLGIVEPMAMETFEYSPVGLRTESYRLTAETTDGREYFSRAFSLVDADLVGWDPSVNVLRIETER